MPGLVKIGMTTQEGKALHKAFAPQRILQQGEKHY